MDTLQHNTSLLTEGEIIEKIINGETALFEILIRRYNSVLYKIARTYGLNHQDAEDMMQETHFTAYTQLKSFRHEASYKTWLSKILIHKCYHKINSGKSKYEVCEDELEKDNIILMQSTQNNSIEHTIINKELTKMIEESLSQIPLHYRSVFVLREIEGFSIIETAELLHITPTNVKVRSNRAKAMLQKQLEKIYTGNDLYEFHLMYCNGIVDKVFKKIDAYLK